MARDIVRVDGHETGSTMGISINAATRRQLFQGAACLLAALGANGAALADSRSERDARDVIANLVDHIFRLISADSGDPGMERRLMDAIESQVDLTLLARMSMGRHWRQANARQRDAFVEVFGRYVLTSFTSRLKSYAGADLGAAGENFVITGTQGAGRKDVIVRSRIMRRSGGPLGVDWRLRPRDGRLVIIDLVVEGVSLLITQRSEFAAVLQRIGVDGLIDELRSRVARTI